MKTILITAVGGDIAQGAATIVREAFPDWAVLGCDAGSRHGGALYADATFAAPRADSSDYLPWLSELVDREGVDICLPMSEAELAVLAAAPMAAQLPLLWAGKQAVEVGTDKLETSMFLRRIGLPGPWTLSSQDADLVPNFPCIFKLRRGSGSKAVFVCNDRQDVDFLRRRYPDSVLQELLPDHDSEITCAVFRSPDGDVSVLQLLRRLAGGMTMWAEVIADDDIEAQCRSIATHLDVSGSINVQLRRTSNGPRIFEINPRLSSTLLMRHAAGFSDVVWMIEDGLGKKGRSRQVPVTGTILVRTFGAAVIEGKGEGK